MKILHLANHCHCIGNGIMNVAVDLACEQARLGHSVSFASGGGSFEALLQSRGVDHYRIVQHWRRPFAMVAGALRLRRLIKRLKPDIVHAHMMSGALLAFVLNTPRQFALVTCVHNEWQSSSSLMRVGDRVIAVSDATRRAMRARGLSDKQLRVVRNGPLGSPRANFDNLSVPRLARPSLLTVCGLYRRKGVLDLIEAFAAIAAKHPAVRLYIAGDGPDRRLFEDTVAGLRLRDRIEFLGFVANPAPLFASADIFVMASHSEPFGLVFAEAREAGCAIVGSDVGGIPEVLEQGAAGLLTPPKDPAALAAALDRLLSDREFRETLGRRAQKNLGWLSCTRMAEETLEVYRECVGPARETALSQGPRARLLARLR